MRASAFILCALFSTAALGDPPVEEHKAPAEEQKVPPHTIAGGRAVVLASLLDSLKLKANGNHATELGCMLDGRACQKVKASTFTVNATHVSCQESHIAVGQFSCDIELKSGAKTQQGKLAGHKAYELITLLQSAGIEAEGAAGHEETIALNVSCVVDMKTLLEREGAGARCVLIEDE